MSHKHKHHPRKKTVRHIKRFILLIVSAILLLTGIGSIWIATMKIPDLASFETRKIVESTKIYDRTGTILLYDTGANTKKTVVSLSDMSPNLKKATIAIEDSNFYNNIGIEPTSIIRAVLANLATGHFGQGASTITQQVIKNALLTQEKTITRKIEEWVLSIKLTKIISKDQILETYLNEAPYGGVVYGAEEASQTFFGRPAKDLTLAQSAYMAAIPQAPTYYSPYGTHKTSLDAREKLVLSRMKALGMITDDEYQSALKEKVNFLLKNSQNIRAPHFVMEVVNDLTEKYGEDMVRGGGLRVTTTLNYDMQQKGEDTINRFSPDLLKNFSASNVALVAIDPKNGDILTMVGSKDYFSKTIDGNFNIATAKRQPGSTFKPFVYTTLFEKGYTPDTVLFDIPTEFSSSCTPDNKPKNPNDDPEKVCYSPSDFDEKYMGPMTIRDALPESRNVPAIQALYLAGVTDSIKTATDMGIDGLADEKQYGLTLVLGGGEVSLLDLTSAYGVFANDGLRNTYRYILRVADQKGDILEEAPEPNPVQVVPAENVRQLNQVISDPNHRPSYLKNITDTIDRTVAIKTGTTNNYRDVWTVGYNPTLAVGIWAGNNDNTPMTGKSVSSLIIAPVWGAFMSQVAGNFPPEDFKAPPAAPLETKPVMHGVWQGGVSYWIDTVSGKVATDFTPPETRKEVLFNNVHNILHWVDKDDPTGPIPTNPEQDGQYANWEYSVREWFKEYQIAHPEFKETTSYVIPTAVDDVHTANTAPKISITSPAPGTAVDPRQMMTIQIASMGHYPALKTEVYVNDKYVLTNTTSPLSVSFVPADVGGLNTTNTIKVVVSDTAYNRGTATVDFAI